MRPGLAAAAGGTWSCVLKSGWPGSGGTVRPGVSPKQQLGDRRYRAEGTVGTDVLGFSFFCLPCPSPPNCCCLDTALSSAAWTPSPQNVSPRWVNIVFLFLWAHDVVVSCACLMPSVPLWPGLQIPGWAFLPMAVLPWPHLCPLSPYKECVPCPQPTVPGSLQSGEGSHSHFLIRFR